MPPMLGSGHHFFILEVEVEVELKEGVPGCELARHGVCKRGERGKSEGGSRRKGVYGLWRER
jgi:hypothetical protein